MNRTWVSDEGATPMPKGIRDVIATSEIRRRAWDDGEMLLRIHEDLHTHERLYVLICPHGSILFWKSVK